MTSLLALLLLGAQPNPPGDLALFCQREGIVGVSVAIASQGKVTTYEGGFADREAKQKVTAETRFRLGSISKPVTAVLVMKQVERGRLNLHQGVSRWVQGFDDRAGRVTLRRVLSHTAGIRHYQAGKSDAQFRPFTVTEGLAVFANDPLLFEPGERYSYSTHGLTLAAAALERAAGTSFVDLVASVELDSLRVEERSKEGVRSKLYAKATPAPRLEAKEEDISWKAGGGGMESTAADLAKFAYGVMDGSLVRSASRVQMWTRQTLNNGRLTSYGLGWSAMSEGRWGHGGSQQGCSTMMICDPAAKKAIVVMANTSGVGPAVKRLAELALSSD